MSETANFECPRCGETWDSPDEFIEDAASKESLHGIKDELDLPNPPYDSTANVYMGTLRTIAAEVDGGGVVPGGNELRIHCGECSMRMADEGAAPGHAMAMVTGMRHANGGTFGL